MDEASVTFHSSAAVSSSDGRLAGRPLRVVHNIQPLDGVGPAAELSGYRFLTMVELDDLDARAEVHRLAWEGSTRSPSDVRATMSTWPYKPELDFVAVADDGSLAASALCWYNPVYSYGEFEPVGTARDHQGQGVGAALLRFG